VGKDTRMPDYLVLVATLGGIVVFGLNGFVIGPVIAAVFLVSWELLASAKDQPLTTPAVAAPPAQPPVPTSSRSSTRSTPTRWARGTGARRMC
jgi:hypothetical protein